jgi:hypothetical protein
MKSGIKPMSDPGRVDVVCESKGVATIRDHDISGGRGPGPILQATTIFRGTLMDNIYHP